MAVLRLTLAGIKEQNGAAMSLGRTSTFLDIYFERDLRAGVLTEAEAQEIMDDFVTATCAWHATCARRNTTSCSAATRCGSPRRSAASG